MNKKGNINVQRRTNLTQSLNTDWKKLDIQFKGISENQSQFKKSLESVVSNIFTSYKNNGFKNDKNLKLLKSYYLIKNLVDKDGRFIDTIQRSKEVTIGFIDEIIQNILKTEFEIDDISIDSGSSAYKNIDNKETKEKRVEEFSSDILSILQDLIKQLPEETLQGNQQSINYVDDNNSIQNVDIEKDTEIQQIRKKENVQDSFQKDKPETVKITEIGKLKRTSKTQNKSLFVKIKQFIMFCISEYEQRNNDVSEKVKINQELSFTGSEEIGKTSKRNKSRKDRRKNLPFSKKDKNGEKLEKNILKNDKQGKKRQKEIISNIKGIKDTADKIGNRNPGLIRKTLGVLNPLNIIKKVFGLFSIVGIVGFVGSTIKSAFNIVKTITKGIWNISKKIIKSVFSLVKGIGKKIFSEQFLKFMTTPQGMFLAGFIYGTIKKWMDKHSNAIENFKTTISEYLKTLMNKVSNTFDKIYPSINQLYLKITQKDFGERISDFINLILNLFKSFTYKNLAISAVKRAGGWAIGKLAFGALKMALVAGSTAAASTGWGMPLAIIGLTALVMAEVGTVLWEQWTIEANRKRHARYNKKIGSTRKKEQFEKFKESFLIKRRPIGSSQKFVSSNIGLLSLFESKPDGKDGDHPVLKGGIGLEKLDYKWIQELMNSIDVNQSERMEEERKNFGHIQGLFLQKSEMIEDEKQALNDAVELLVNRSTREIGDDYQRAINVPTIDLYVNGLRVVDLENVYDDPLWLRVLNAIRQQEWLQENYTEENILKYLKNPEQFDKDFNQFIKGIFAIKDGKMQQNGKELTEHFANGSIISGDATDGSGTRKTQVYNDAIRSLKALSSSLTEHQVKMTERQFQFKAFSTLANKRMDINCIFLLELILNGKVTNLKFNSDLTFRYFLKILECEKVSKKLRERNIDMAKKKQDTWREYIGFWISQNKFIEKFKDIFDINKYISHGKENGSGILIVNNDLEKERYIWAGGWGEKWWTPTQILSRVIEERPLEFISAINRYKFSEQESDFIKSLGLRGVEPTASMKEHKNYDFRAGWITNDNAGLIKCGNQKWFTELMEYDKYVTEILKDARTNGIPWYDTYKQDLNRGVNFRDYFSILTRRTEYCKFFDDSLPGEVTEQSSNGFGLGRFQKEKKNNVVYTYLAKKYVKNMDTYVDFYFNSINSYKINNDEQLTNEIVEKVLNEFIDFIYPFLANYFQNLDKFDGRFAASYNKAGGGSLGLDFINAFSGFLPNLEEKVERFSQRVFGGEDSNPIKDYEALKKRDEENQRIIRELEQKNEAEQKKAKDNQDQADKLEKTHAQLLERRKQLGLSGDSNSCVTAISRKRKSRRKLLQDRERMDQGHSYGTMNA